MRILITGAGGLLGGRLATLLATDHDTVALTRLQPPPPGVPGFTADLTRAERVAEVLREVQPDAVLHCAALADAEVCERDPGRARQDNVEATRILARLSCLQGARLITMSTDLVFNGEQPWSSEDSAAEPVNEYGRSKLAAEQAASEQDPTCTILRVALLCGRGFGDRRSASESIAGRLKRGETVTLFDDEWRTPIDPESLALAVRAVLSRPHARGRFHIGGADRLTRYELGERVARALTLDTSLLRKAGQASHSGAPRPRDASLETSRARSELGWEPRPLELSLREGRLD